MTEVIAAARGPDVYKYPPLFPLSSIAIAGIATAVVCAILFAVISTRVFRLRQRATLWLIVLTVVTPLTALVALWDVPPVLKFWDSVKNMTGVILFAALFCLSMTAIAPSKPGQITLGELVVIIGVTAGMIWYLTPPLVHPVDVSRSNQCSNNLKEIAIGIHNHAEHANGETIGTIARTGDGPPRSWRVELLPFLDQERLRKRYDDLQTWDAPANNSVAKSSKHPFACPNNVTPVDDRMRSYTAYLACTGPTAFFPPPATGNGRGFTDIPDGTSHTVMVVEACGQNVIWTEPRDLDVDRVPLGINLPGFQRGESSGLLSSHDPSSVGMVMGDGSVRRLSAGVDPSVLKAVLTIDGGEPAYFD